jgi:hypothetical protein
VDAEAAEDAVDADEVVERVVEEHQVHRLVPEVVALERRVEQCFKSAVVGDYIDDVSR